MSGANRERGPSRRQLVVALLATGGALAAAGGGWWIVAQRRRWPGRRARGWIDASVLDSAVRLGEEHLAAAPDFDPGMAWRELDARLAPWPAEGLGDARFRSRARAAIEEDFAAESTVEILGYRFALTEARLCALVALGARAESGGA